jgi:uncharacterized protein (TIGR04222 family)
VDDRDKRQLERVEGFELDERGVAFAFSHRLARDNRWTLPFARRVVREYKRFAWLAARSGHPLTPSDQVDQAWHLHLIYSASYARFCNGTLGAPLHHHPTQGGAQEAVKFRAWYQRTLEAYRTCFGQEPPPDIWPPAERRFGEDLCHARVQTGRSWIIPKPSVWLAERWSNAAGEPAARARGTLLALSSVLAAAGAGCALIGSVPPFDFAGPGFLAFFAVVWLLSFLVAKALYSPRPDPEPGAQLPELKAHELAYLAGGPELFTSSVITGLVDRGVMAYDAGTERVHLGPLSHSAIDAVEEPLWERICGEGGCALAELQECARDLSVMTAARLKALGLHDGRVAVVPLLVALLAPALGVIRIGVGVLRDKPVGILVMLCVLAATVAARQFCAPRPRTARGEAVLARLRERHAQLPQELAAGSPVVPHAASLAVALFGVGVLSSTALAQLAPALAPSATAGGGQGTGGGDGCGGGGCGGGGCGGCG